jgi:hypothetical protein
MSKSYGKNKDVSLLKDLGKEPVFRERGHKPNKEAAFQDGKNLTCTRVNVRSDETTLCEVKANECESKGV